MLNQEELKARIEEEKKILEFYVRYEKDIIQMSTKTEWELGVNDCLDNLNSLYELLKD